MFDLTPYWQGLRYSAPQLPAIQSPRMGPIGMPDMRGLFGQIAMLHAMMTPQRGPVEDPRMVVQRSYYTDPYTGQTSTARSL